MPSISGSYWFSDMSHTTTACSYTIPVQLSGVFTGVPNNFHCMFGNCATTSQRCWRKETNEQLGEHQNWMHSGLMLLKSKINQSITINCYFQKTFLPCLVKEGSKSSLQILMMIRQSLQLTVLMRYSTKKKRNGEGGGESKLELKNTKKQSQKFPVFQSYLSPSPVPDGMASDRWLLREEAKAGML